MLSLAMRSTPVSTAKSRDGFDFSYLLGILQSVIPALICIGHDHLNKTNALFSKYAKASFDFYIIHFPVVVLSQYFLSRSGMNIILNFFLTLVIAYPVTYLICVLVSKVKKYVTG